MDNVSEAIAQFNAQARANNWVQYCDPGNAFVMRECDELIELWNWARGERDLPARDDLPARALKPYLQRLSIVERIQDDPPRFKFRLVGTIITRSLSERTGQAFDHESATKEQTERWTYSSLLSLAVKQPLRFPTMAQRLMVGEMLLLPLADETGTPRFVLAYGRYEPTRDWSVRETRAFASAS
ncbi:MAG: PAS domain-containing protein [Proteobacteria bacterium]|nr:PAS domain-containing protein [Pseudomonadota bacterium]